MIITKISPLTGNSNTMDLDITNEQLQRWKDGELIQNVMPNLTPAEREFLITGYTQDDWDVMFGEK